MAHERSPFGVAVDLEHRPERPYDIEDVSHVLLHGKPAASQHPELNAVLARLAVAETVEVI